VLEETAPLYSMAELEKLLNLVTAQKSWRQQVRVEWYVLENTDEPLLAAPRTVKILIREVRNLVLNTIKILQNGSKECDKFAETRRGIQMMEGGRDEVQS
jgi:hypothetical protein